VISVPVVRGKHKLRMSEDRVVKIIFGRRNGNKHDGKIKKN
jgi:hypothetical protein